MRVGIITQHLSANYGGILQNWALQQVLLRLGHELLTFEHDTCYSRSRWLLRTVKQVLQTRSLASLPAYPYRGRVGHRTFIDFIIRNIRSVPVHDFTPSLECRYGCEAFIVGSDQVWRPAFNQGRLYNMYLDFASDSVRKIAYAASFGVLEWEYTEVETRKCRDLVRRFDAVSVREESAVILCREHLGVEAAWVLDPTLLLDREDYMLLCKGCPQETDIVLVYAMHLTDDMQSLAKQLAQGRGCRVKILQAGNKLKPEDTIEHWVAAFRDAGAVVTDSFHGMAFSVIFNKPFYIYKNESGGTARYESLMKQLGLGAHFVGNGDELPSEEMDWEGINARREELKHQSLNFITNALI